MKPRQYPFKLLLAVGPLVSIAVSPWTNFDPINLIKLLVLSTIALSSFGYFISNFKIEFKQKKSLFIISLGFVLSLISTFFFSGAPKTQQFWGMFGRNTGLLTYLSLIIILIGVALSHNQDFYRKLLLSLIFVSVPISLYSLIQIAKLDPITWSSQETFATFGNTNFLSSFLGISASACMVYSSGSKFSKKLILTLRAFALLEILIVSTTNSIQGLMIFAASILVFGFIYLWKIIKRVALTLMWSGFCFIAFGLTSAALFNKGPLAKFIFQESIVYRSDYMHAGWAMLNKKPIFGVGLDSYGDWYRTLRGSISTNRNGVDRTANTAHNVFLDIASNGGYLMIISYLALIVLAFHSSIRYLRKNDYDPVFNSLFIAWLAYLIQASISINQIGVGIWGWLFTGSMIGYGFIKSELSRSPDRLTSSGKRITRNSTANSFIPVTSSVLGIIGFLLAFFPMKADMEFRTGLVDKNLTKLIQATDLFGASAWHYDVAVNAAASNNFGEQALTLNRKLLIKYPRDYFGWRSLYYLNVSTREEKIMALKKMHELDPFNGEIPKS